MTTFEILLSYQGKKERERKKTARNEEGKKGIYERKRNIRKKEITVNRHTDEILLLDYECPFRLWKRPHQVGQHNKDE